MATIMSMFSRRRPKDSEAKDLSFTQPSLREDSEAKGLGFTIPSVREDAMAVRDSDPFEQLGEDQQLIDGGIDAVVQNLEAISGIAKQLSGLRKQLAHSFEAHRKLAFASAVMEQDRAHIRQSLREKSAQHELVTRELRTLRGSFDDVSRGFDKTRADLDTLNNKFHLLSVAKKEADESLQNALAQLLVARDDAEDLRSDISALKALNDASVARITELSDKTNNTNDKNVFLTTRIDTLESALQEKTADIIGLRELNDLLCQERDSAVVYARQKEQETTQVRSEAAKFLQQSQQEKKSREVETIQLRSELDLARANLKAHEEIGTATRIENDKLVVEVNRLEDRNKSLESATARVESQSARLAAKLESTLTAKSQIEQSRAVIGARLEVLTQTLSERDEHVRRIEAEFETQTIKSERQSAIAQDNIDALHARIFELEKDLISKQNEVSYYSSQLEALNRYDLKPR